MCTLEFDEAPMVIGEHKVGIFSGSAELDDDGDIVIITVKPDFGPGSAPLILKWSQQADPFFAALAAGIEDGARRAIATRQLWIGARFAVAI